VSVFAAVGEGKSRRVGKPARRAVHDLGDQRERLKRARAEFFEQQHIVAISLLALFLNAGFVEADSRKPLFFTSLLDADGRTAGHAAVYQGAAVLEFFVDDPDILPVDLCVTVFTGFSTPTPQTIPLATVLAGRGIGKINFIDNPDMLPSPSFGQFFFVAHAGAVACAGPKILVQGIGNPDIRELP